MFITVREPVDIYDKPSLNGNIVGQIGKGQEVKTQGESVTAEGWIWREIEGGGLWVLERSVDGNDLLIVLEWQGAGQPKVSISSSRLFPAQPAQFTNRVLLTAFQTAAQTLGAPDAYIEWLKQAQIPWIQTIPDEIYEGTPIAELPLEDEIKLTVLAKLTVASTERPVFDPKRKPQGRFTTQGTQFFLDGQPFRFVGVNVRELAYYGGFGGWTHGQFTRPEHIDIQLETAHQMRAQVFRIYAPYARNGQGIEKTDAQEAIKRIKKVLDKAQKLNMFALITLDDAKQSGFNVSVSDNGKYREPGYVSNMAFYYEGYQEQYIPFVKAVVGALGGHPAIFAWGIANESQVNPFIPPTPPEADCEAFLNYYKHTSEVIRSLAPNDLITTSVESSRVLFVVNAYGGKKYTNQLYTLPTIDFATIHSYQDRLRMDNLLGHNDEDGRMELELARMIWKKPVIIEEMGPVGGVGRHGAGWVAGAVAEWFKIGAAGVMQWGFSAMTDDVGVGDADSGMHNVGGHPSLPGGDWGALFEVYRNWGQQLWVGK